jgi:thioredoxin 1
MDEGAMTTDYLTLEETPTREEVDRMPGLVVLEFGTELCGICRAAAPRIAEHLARHPEIRHIKVEDGSGRRLGRSFHVKLWPNLVFLKDGRLVRQLARPDEGELEEAFVALCSRPAP